MKLKFIFICFIFTLGICKKTEAQSDFYWANQVDFGLVKAPTFSQNNISKKFISPQSSISTSFLYRWKDLVSLELGVGQYYQNLKLKDKTFEQLNDGFSVKLANKNSYWNYFGAIGFDIPLNNSTFIYTKFAYSINNYGVGNVSKSENFIYTEKQINQNINSSTTYFKTNTSLIPEIGLQFKLNNDNLFSLGLKMNLGQSTMSEGTYQVTDVNTNTLLYNDNFNSKGNFTALNFKYAVLLHHSSKKTKEHEVVVCHYGKKMKIPFRLLETHLAHGDTRGECKKTSNSIPEKEPEIKEKEEKEEEIFVCHFGKNKKIPARLLDIHLKHGDSEGKCEKNKELKPEKEPKPEKEKDELKVDKDGIPKTLNDREVVKNQTIYVESTNVTFKIWDSGKEVDGDTISLNLNGEWIVEGFGLSRDKHSVEAQIKPNQKNFLMLFALNLGKYPPNTAAVSVWDGEREQVLELKSDLKTCGALNIVYRPK